MSDRKVPWGHPGSPWKNDVAFFTYLRGCLRKAWSRNPIKLNLIKKKRKQIENPNPRGKKATVWGFTCECCGGTFILSQGEVDHIESAGKLSSLDDVRGFVERLLFVTEDDLRLLCKTCHRTITYADKQGLSFKEAEAVKRAISICKDNLDKQFLIDNGLSPASSKAKRRIQIEEFLKG